MYFISFDKNDKIPRELTQIIKNNEGNEQLILPFPSAGEHIQLTRLISQYVGYTIKIIFGIWIIKLFYSDLESICVDIIFNTLVKMYF